MDFEILTKLKQWFYKDLDNIVAFHFHLTNIILLLINDQREGEFYCFCNKVRSTMIFLEIKKTEEHVEEFQPNHEELNKIADGM